MWSSKTAAKTFFARLFDNKKKSAKQQHIKDDDIEDDAAAMRHGRRKRSHSLFAPNMNALIAGHHVGGSMMGHHHQLAGRVEPRLF